jgi:hypothetical protein
MFKAIEQCVSVWLECLVLLQTVDQNVNTTRIAHQTELVFNKNVLILVLDLAVLMLSVMFITISQFADVLKVTMVTLTQDVVFDKVSPLFIFTLFFLLLPSELELSCFQCIFLCYLIRPSHRNLSPLQSFSLWCQCYL